MTPAQISLVQTSFESLKPIAAQAGLMFYDRLFTVDPSLRPMFRGNIDEQSRKLMQVLAIAVSSLTRIDQLVPVLEEMGAKHVRYGVAAQHYDTVGACLLWTLDKGFGDAFTSELRDAWTAVYTLVAGTMQCGAAMAAAAA